MKTLQHVLALVRELTGEEIEIISGGTYEGSGPSSWQVSLTTCAVTFQTPQGSTTVSVTDDATPIVVID